MKRIVLLSDGTGNSAAKRHKTNVWRLYKALDLPRSDQIAMYDDGVGTQEFLLPRLLGSVFGYGLKTNVIQLYKFLCRNHEDGDKIYLFGFSRGAFTVRVLAGLIDRCGLCTDFTSERDLHEAARTNFAAYRKKNYKRRYFSKLLSWEEGCQCQETDDEESCVGHRVEIEFIGVWDTVDAYGLPVDELRDLWDRFIYPLRFKSRKLGKKVKRACHAVSIDDERHTFHPVLWDESEESNEKDPCRIEQVWFPGVHSDVGGGYPRHELALVSLDWMMSKAELPPEGSKEPPEPHAATAKSEVKPGIQDKPGLIFRADLREECRQRSDWNGTQHDSRAGLRAYYRYRPRNIEELWRSACSCRPPKIHRSAFGRIQAQVVPYAPTGLPMKYDIVPTTGESHEFENEEQAESRRSAMNGALDVIFWRKCLYFALLVTTLMVAATPFALNWETDAACADTACALNPVCELSKAVLPGNADAWIAALCQNPRWFLLSVCLYAIWIVAKMKASALTFNRAEVAWCQVKRSKASAEWTTATSRLRSLLGGKVGRVLLKTWWALVFLMILVAIIVAADRTAFHMRDCVGCMCGESSVRTLATGEETVEFKTDDPCMTAELELVAGTVYKFEVDEIFGWMDGTLPAGPDGLAVSTPFLMRASTPFRRHLSRPWFELMGRTGRSGSETFPIGSGTCYSTRSGGPLHLYVNDGVSGLMPGSLWAFPYRWSLGENKGTATVKITAMGPSLGCGGTTDCASCSSR